MLGQEKSGQLEVGGIKEVRKLGGRELRGVFGDS